MTLASGARVGSYEVVAKLGEGGMGEVYRARDHRLNRDVALKILSAAFTADPDRLARFEREAQVLASLQHANIAAIYGIEESPSTGSGQAGLRALVLELVEGPTLADRIALGPIPVTEAIAIARQLADALGAAHDAGIVHRDLKPANIKVREDGTVKVLDFGLAKAGNDDRSGVSGPISDSPTLTARATQMGTIIGTAAYMAPEQARGKAVDRRADLWAFGVVLYEMLTGRRAFDGREITDVLASVIKDTPSLDALPPEVPASVRRLLRRTLEKDRAKRLDSMAAARLELDEVIAGESAGMPVGPSKPSRAWARGIGLIGVPVASAAVAAAIVWRVMLPAAPEVRRLTISADANAALTIETNHNDVVITPDGRHVVYFSRLSQNQFVVRPIDKFEPIIHTKLGLDPRGPGLSPDGRWIVFQVGSPVGNDAQLAKVPLEGGSSGTICKFDGNLRGTSWGTDDTILFATTAAGSGIQRVPAAGGTVDVLTTPATADGELDHFWPQLLPDGRHALFAIMRGDRTFDIALLTLESRTWRVLVKNGTYPRYASTGHLLFGSGGVLKAVPFDVSRLEVRGNPVEVLPGLLVKEAGAADFAISRDGTLVYLAGAVQAIERPLAWRDGAGRETGLAIPPANFNEMRISPDERSAVAVVGQAASFELWLLDLTRELSSRLTASEYRAAAPIWSPDGKRIAFWSPGRIGTTDPGGIFLISATGTGQPERVTTAEGSARHVPSSFTPDGRTVLFTAGGTTLDVMKVSLDEPRSVTPVLAGPDPEAAAVVSPNGRWLAYTQVEVRPQIFIRPYPLVDQLRIPVSAESSQTPVWSQDGRSLYFSDRNLTALFVVDVTESGGTLVVSPPRRVAAMRDETSSFGNLGLPPVKGRVLAAARPTGPARPPEYRVILNWFEELKKLTGKQ